MKKITRLIIMLAAMAIANGNFRAFAQVFPVQANTQLLPPYSLYLSDYVSPTADNFIVNLFLNDLDRPQYDVRLRVTIEGVGITLQTRESFVPAPISLQGGMLTRLTGADLAAYFEPQNLNFQGITRQGFQRTGKLPEGVYQFCVEVLDFNRGDRVSNISCASAWLLLNDPPLVNLPEAGATVFAQDPQYMVFQWTPRNTGSPNSAFTTEYDFSLIEIWPKERNPFDAINTSAPIFETTTTNTALIYGPSDPALIPGRQYAFRIQARDMGGRDLFKNQGYTEVVWFEYAYDCKVPLNMRSQAVDARRMDILWDPVFGHSSFNIRYKEQADPTAEWFSREITRNQVTLSSLAPGTTYEYQVQGFCDGLPGEYSQVMAFSTPSPSASDFVCGQDAPEFNLENNQLKETLGVGEKILAGDVEVEITQINGANGVFSGEGTVELPFLNYLKIKAIFQNITINSENRLIAGEIQLTGAGL